MKLTEYFSGVINAALGRANEGFVSSPASALTSVQNLYSSLPIVFILHLTAMMVYGLGAARLSYCHQLNTNPGSYFFYVYIGLAFLFSPVYYPFYSIVLHQCKR